VTEESTEVEKITGAATKVQNIKWWRTIEPEVLRTLDVYPDPVRCVFVGVDLPRIGPVGILFSEAFQFCPVNPSENLTRIDRMGPATSVFPEAFCCVARKKLLKFAGKSHVETMPLTAR